MDISGETDPYAEVRFVYPADIATGIRSPDVVFYTSAPKNDYNPVWEETFRCQGRPERVDVTLCDKDFGLKGGLVRGFNILMGLCDLLAVNSLGDEIIGVQRRNYRKLFQLLTEETDGTTMRGAIDPIQYTLPLMDGYPKAYSDLEKPTWVYSGEDTEGKPKVSTLSMSCGVGRSLYSADTCQVLGQVGDLGKMMTEQFNQIRKEMADLRKVMNGEQVDETERSKLVSLKVSQRMKDLNFNYIPRPMLDGKGGSKTDTKRPRSTTNI